MDCSRAQNPLGVSVQRPIAVRAQTAPLELRRAVEDGDFRQDLYYRFNVVDIHLPPLRERPEDIPLLTQYFVENSAQTSRVKRLAPETLRALLNYPWPGNIRELENVIERALILCQGEEIRPNDLPAHFMGIKPQLTTLQDALLRRRPLSEIEREYTLLALAFTEGRKKEAAELLGTDRKTRYRELEEHGRAESAGR